MPCSYSLAASRICSGRKVICFSTLAGSPNALLTAQIENKLGQREGSGAVLWVWLRTAVGGRRSRWAADGTPLHSSYKESLPLTDPGCSLPVSISTRMVSFNIFPVR